MAQKTPDQKWGTEMKMLHTAAVAAALALGLSSAARADSTAWDMPTPYPDGNFHTQNIAQFADEVKAATDGALTITVYSNGSLIKATEIKAAVQSGQVQAGEILMSSLGNEDPVLSFDAIPGLAPNYEKAAKLWAAAHDIVAKHFDAQGLVMLYSVPWPPQGVYSKTELKALADLKGLKFRSYNPATARFAQLVGANPVTVQAAEVAQAFRTGIVDAMITSGATGVDTQSWDYLNYYYNLQAFLPQNVVFVSKDAFAALTDAEKKAVLDAATAAEKRGWAKSAELNDGYKKTMAEHGMNVVQPNDTMVGELAKIGDVMSAEWAEKAGPDGVAILEAYRK